MQASNFKWWKTFEVKLAKGLLIERPRLTRREKGSLTRDKLVKGGALVRWFPASTLIVQDSPRGNEQKSVGCVEDSAGVSLTLHKFD